METAPLISDLLDPISPERPAGEDLRWSPEWDRIREARRADDDFDPGKWAKRDRKSSEWRVVRDLASSLLRERSKDLQLALWLTEADMRIRGFAGMRDGLHITRELMLRYWDAGLFPSMEDGPEDRSGPLQWLNDKLVESATNIEITARADGGDDLTYIGLQEARRTGSEASYRNRDGEIDPVKKKAYDAAVSAGRPSLESFNRAVKETPRAAYEELSAEFFSLHDEFKALEKVVDEKFGDLAPNLSACRNTFGEMRQAISDVLNEKRLQEPDVVPVTPPPGEDVDEEEKAELMKMRFAIPLPPIQPGSSSGRTSWQDAELLIRNGEVDKGLSEMTRLAAAETSGRSRFERKLMLAAVCLASKRERLARSILEELAEQIDKYQLEFWESSELIGSVWIRLHKLYKSPNAQSGDADKADKLYLRLCRLDPWQALQCADN